MAGPRSTKYFRLLKRTRQATEYSCGASALRSVLSYWGRDVEEADLMKLVRTTPEEGTYPEDLARGARELGFEAEVRENLTLDEVSGYTADGSPVIALGQFWRSQRDSPSSVHDDWDSGHYIVILAVDKEYVYFQDPYIRMSKAFVPRNVFEEHWHQVMGGDRRRNPKLIHLAIFVRGKERPELESHQASNRRGLDFSRFGSLNLLVVQFKGPLLPFDLLSELKSALDVECIRANAFIFLRKDENGVTSGIEGCGLDDDDEIVGMNALLAAIASRSVASQEARSLNVESAIRAAIEGDFGLDADGIREIAQRLPPSASAIAVLFENVWERRFREIVQRHGGALVGQTPISSEDMLKAAAAFNADRVSGERQRGNEDRGKSPP